MEHVLILEIDNCYENYEIWIYFGYMPNMPILPKWKSQVLNKKIVDYMMKWE